MAEPNRWLFDASATRRLVLAHRGAGAPAVRCVVVPLPPDLPGAARIDLAAGRLTRLLREPDPVPLRTVAAEVDALGEAAVGALVTRTSPGDNP
jgi:hypothetical protein